MAAGGTCERHLSASETVCHSVQEAAARHDKLFAAHSRLRDRDSDALSALNALIAFEAAATTERAAFCDNHQLHLTPLREMAALHTQLKHMLSLTATCETLKVSQHRGAAELARQYAAQIPEAPTGPVNVQHGRLLRRCLAAGWPDQIGRRCRNREQVTAAAATVRPVLPVPLILFLHPQDCIYRQCELLQGKRRAVRYQGCSLEEEVFLHPRSALHRSAPDLVLFQSLLRTDKRTYMQAVSAVEPPWLADVGGALAQVSAPLSEPRPAYSVARDKVLAWFDCKYGMHAWPLPAHAGAFRKLLCVAAVCFVGGDDARLKLCRAVATLRVR